MKKRGGSNFNYSAIEQNSNHIKDLFKKLNDRDANISNRQAYVREKLFKNLSQNQQYIGMKEYEFQLEQEQIKKYGVKLGARAQKRVMPKVGRGRADLDTGLDEDLKKIARGAGLESLAQIEGLQFNKADCKKTDLVRDIFTAAKSNKYEQEVDRLDTEQDESPSARARKQLAEEEEFMAMYTNQKRERVLEAEKEVKQLLEDRIKLVKDDGVKTNEKTILRIFSRDKKLQSQVSHLDYMSCLDRPNDLKMIISFLRRQFQFEIQAYGEHLFEKIIQKECSDRRLLFKLVNSEITFDQFLVRIHCDTRGVSYKCKDDLVKDHGVSEVFFDPETMEKKESFLKQIHGVKRMEDVKAENIAAMGGFHLEEKSKDSNLREFSQTDIEVRRDEELHKKLNQWRSSTHCLRSIFSVVPEEILKKQEDSKAYKMIKFGKAQRFKSAERSRRPQQPARTLKARKRSEPAKTLLGKKTLQPKPELKIKTNLAASPAASALPSALVGPSDKTAITSTVDVESPLLQDSEKKRSFTKPSRLGPTYQNRDTRHSLLFIRQMLQDGKQIFYDETQNARLLYKNELDRHVKRQEQLNVVKSKKMGVKDILKRNKSPTQQRTHSNERDNQMNIVQDQQQPPTLQLDDDEEEPEVEINKGMLIIPKQLLLKTPGSVEAVNTPLSRESKQPDFSFDRKAFRKNLEKMIKKNIDQNRKKREETLEDKPGVEGNSRHQAEAMHGILDIQQKQRHPQQTLFSSGSTQVNDQVEPWPSSTFSPTHFVHHTTHLEAVQSRNIITKPNESSPTHSESHLSHPKNESTEDIHGEQMTASPLGKLDEVGRAQFLVLRPKGRKASAASRATPKRLVPNMGSQKNSHCDLSTEYHQQQSSLAYNSVSNHQSLVVNNDDPLLLSKLKQMASNSNQKVLSDPSTQYEPQPQVPHQLHELVLGTRNGQIESAAGSPEPTPEHTRLPIYSPLSGQSHTVNQIQNPIALFGGKVDGRQPTQPCIGDQQEEDLRQLQISNRQLQQLIENNQAILNTQAQLLQEQHQGIKEIIDRSDFTNMDLRTMDFSVHRRDSGSKVILKGENRFSRGFNSTIKPSYRKGFRPKTSGVRAKRFSQPHTQTKSATFTTMAGTVNSPKNTFSKQSPRNSQGQHLNNTLQQAALGKNRSPIHLKISTSQEKSEQPTVLRTSVSPPQQQYPTGGVRSGGFLGPNHPACESQNLQSRVLTHTTLISPLSAQFKIEIPDKPLKRKSSTAGSSFGGGFRVKKSSSKDIEGVTNTASTKQKSMQRSKTYLTSRPSLQEVESNLLGGQLLSHKQIEEKLREIALKKYKNSQDILAAISAINAQQSGAIPGVVFSSKPEEVILASQISNAVEGDFDKDARRSAAQDSHTLEDVFSGGAFFSGTPGNFGAQNIIMESKYYNKPGTNINASFSEAGAFPPAREITRSQSKFIEYIQSLGIQVNHPPIQESSTSLARLSKLGQKQGSKVSLDCSPIVSKSMNAPLKTASGPPDKSKTGDPNQSINNDNQISISAGGIQISTTPAPLGSVPGQATPLQQPVAKASQPHSTIKPESSQAETGNYQLIVLNNQGQKDDLEQELFQEPIVKSAKQSDTSDRAKQALDEVDQQADVASYLQQPSKPLGLDTFEGTVDYRERKRDSEVRMESNFRKEGEVDMAKVTEEVNMILSNMSQEVLSKKEPREWEDSEEPLPSKILEGGPKESSHTNREPSLADTLQNQSLIKGKKISANSSTDLGAPDRQRSYILQQPGATLDGVAPILENYLSPQSVIKINSFNTAKMMQDNQALLQFFLDNGNALSGAHSQETIEQVIGLLRQQNNYDKEFFDLFLMQLQLMSQAATPQLQQDYQNYMLNMLGLSNTNPPGLLNQLMMKFKSNAAQHMTVGPKITVQDQQEQIRNLEIQTPDSEQMVPRFTSNHQSALRAKEKTQPPHPAKPQSPQSLVSPSAKGEKADSKAKGKQMLEVTPKAGVVRQLSDSSPFRRQFTSYIGSRSAVNEELLNSVLAKGTPSVQGTQDPLFQTETFKRYYLQVLKKHQDIDNERLLKQQKQLAARVSPTSNRDSKFTILGNDISSAHTAQRGRPQSSQVQSSKKSILFKTSNLPTDQRYRNNTLLFTPQSTLHQLDPMPSNNSQLLHQLKAERAMQEGQYSGSNTLHMGTTQQLLREDNQMGSSSQKSMNSINVRNIRGSASTPGQQNLTGKNIKIPTTSSPKLETIDSKLLHDNLLSNYLFRKNSGSRGIIIHQQSGIGHSHSRGSGLQQQHNLSRILQTTNDDLEAELDSKFKFKKRVVTAKGVSRQPGVQVYGSGGSFRKKMSSKFLREDEGQGLDIYSYEYSQQKKKKQKVRQQEIPPADDKSGVVISNINVNMIDKQEGTETEDKHSILQPDTPHIQKISSRQVIKGEIRD